MLVLKGMLLYLLFFVTTMIIVSLCIVAVVALPTGIFLLMRSVGVSMLVSEIVFIISVIVSGYSLLKAVE